MDTCFITSEDTFNLSGEIIGTIQKGRDRRFVWVEDVKEFIRRLKEDLRNRKGNINHVEIFEEWDKLAGSKLLKGGVK